MTIEAKMEELRSLAASTKMDHFLRFEFSPPGDMLFFISCSGDSCVRLGFYRDDVETLSRQLSEAAKLMK